MKYFLLTLAFVLIAAQSAKAEDMDVNAGSAPPPPALEEAAPAEAPATAMNNEDLLARSAALGTKFNELGRTRDTPPSTGFVELKLLELNEALKSGIISADEMKSHIDALDAVAAAPLTEESVKSWMDRPINPIAAPAAPDAAAAPAAEAPAE